MQSAVRSLSVASSLPLPQTQPCRRLPAARQLEASLAAVRLGLAGSSVVSAVLCLQLACAPVSLAEVRLPPIDTGELSREARCKHHL